jgi:peptide deformylase
LTIRPIRYLGDPALRRPAKPVRHVSESIRRLIEDMYESMHVAQGVGLAAPQIGVGLRIFVVGMPDEEPFALVNPEVLTATGSRVMEAEGCLSVPGYRGSLARSQRVVMRGLGYDGEPLSVEAAENLLAEALEHELDHLNGVLYVDHLAKPDDLVKLGGQGWADTRPGAREGAEGGSAGAAARGAAAGGS